MGSVIAIETVEVVEHTVSKGFCRGCGCNYDRPGDFCKCEDPIPEGATEIQRLQVKVANLERRLANEQRAKAAEQEHLADQVLFWKRLARRVNVVARNLV